MTRTRQAGAALVAALFLIIVLAALGATIASLSNVEHATAVKSQLSTSVYYGAKTGLEWGIQRVISDPAPPARCTAFAAGTAFSPAGAGFPGVTVTVTCVQSSIFGVGNFVYYLTSDATVGNLGALNYAERHMEATVSNISMTARSMMRLTIHLVAVTALAFAHLDANAAARFARATGLWNAAIWSATSCVAGVLTASVPGAADDATICAGNTVTLDSSRTANTVIVNGSLSTSTFTLTIDNTPAITLNSGGSFTGNAVLILDNTTTVAAGTSAAITFNNLSLMFNVALGGSRAYTLGAGSIASMTVTGNFDIVPTNAGGAARALNVGRGTVTTLAVTGRTRIAALGAGNDSASLNTTGMTTLTSGTLVLGDAAGGTGSNTLTATTAAITLNGATGPLFTRTANGVFTAGTSTVTMNSGGTSPVSLTSGTFLTTNAFNNLTVNMASPPRTGTLGADITVNTDLLVQAGTLSTNGFAVSGDGTTQFTVNDGATFDMTGTSVFPTNFSTYTFQCTTYPGTCSTVRYLQTDNQTISPRTYGHLEIKPTANSPVVHTLAAGTTAVNGDLTIGNGTNTGLVSAVTVGAILDVSGNFSIAAAATFTANALSAFTVARNWTRTGTFTHSSGTVTFDDTTASAIGGSTTTFNNLVLNKSAAVAVTTNVATTVVATLTLSNANTTLADGGNTITVNGHLVSSGGTHSGTGKILLTGNGGAVHNISGVGGTWGNLEIDETNGAALLALASPTISGVLTLTAGDFVTTATTTLTIASTGSISGAGTTKHVVGNLARTFSAATTFTYAIGDGTNYTPVLVVFDSAVTGNLTATVVSPPADHPNTQGTGTASGIGVGTSVNRYWTLKNSTITGTYSATFTYVATDLDTPTAPAAALFSIRRGATCSGAPRNCLTWVGMTVAPTPTTIQAIATSISIVSGAAEADFAIGQITPAGNLTRERQFIYTREFY